MIELTDENTLYGERVNSKTKVMCESIVTLVSQLPAKLCLLVTDCIGVLVVGVVVTVHIVIVVVVAVVVVIVVVVVVVAGRETALLKKKLVGSPFTVKK